jgi:hypothetical protein
MSLVESLPYSLSQPGPDSIEGIGNYHIDVLAPSHNSKHSALTLYFLDTHSYSPDERHFRGYDWLKPKQIDWFTAEAKKLKDSPAHKHYAKIHLDMAFIHIPLPEYRNPPPDDKKATDLVGEWREGVTAPGFNTHFHDALIAAGVHVVSCGHDHANDYCLLSRNAKTDKGQLWMCYAGGSGFGGYGGYGGYIRRVRVWEVDTEVGSVRTWKRVEAGPDVGRRVDERVVVEGGVVKG